MSYFNCAKCRDLHDIGPLLGRICLSLIFIFAGVSKFFAFEASMESLKAFGLTHGTAVYVIFALLMELIGGLMILLGFYSRVGSLILMVYLLPATLIYHSFWSYTGIESAIQFANFLKNLTIYGGLLLLLSYGPGKWSLDYHFPAKKKK